MEKTTVYLSAEQKAALARAAAVEGRSEARLIRAGIDIVTARHRTREAPTVPTYETSTAESSRPARPRWLSRDAFVREVLGRAADVGLRAEIRDLAPDTTDAAER